MDSGGGRLQTNPRLWRGNVPRRAPYREFAWDACAYGNPRADASAYAGVAYRVSAPFDGEVPEFEDNGGVLEGLGEKGGSAAGRLLRETVESKSASVAAKL